MTEILSDYYDFYTRYSKEYLSKIEKKQRHIDLMEWQKKEYNELPTLDEIIDFIKDKENLKSDVVFLKNTLIKRVIEDINNNNLDSLKYTFSLVDEDHIGYSIDPINLICEETDFIYTRIELADKVLENDEKNQHALRYNYKLLEKFIGNSIHELPSGVLYGNDGASIEELEEMQKDLFDFKDLSNKLEKSNDDFIDFCFRIYNAYGDYLINRESYKGFVEYLEKHEIPYE